MASTQAARELTSDEYTPKKEDKFSFGLWTVGNRGRDPFGEFVRPTLDPVYIVKKLSELGAWGVNLHDNDLVPFDATPAERDRIVREFKQALADYDMVVPMATTTSSFTRFSKMVLLPPTTRRCAPSPCKRPCAPSTSARNWARIFMSSGAGARAPSPMPPKTRWLRCSACARPSTSSASTCAITATRCALPWSRSPTSRAPTSTCPPSATCSASSTR